MQTKLKNHKEEIQRRKYQYTKDEKWLLEKFGEGPLDKAKALGMPPRSNSLFKNLKKLVREKFLKEKKKKNKIHFMRM